MSERPAQNRSTEGKKHLAAWRGRGRIPVPTRKGGTMEMQILHLIEATAVDDVPVDLVVEARAGKRGPVRRFAVVFADQRPERDFTIPCLWFSEAGGVWLDG